MQFIKYVRLGDIDNKPRSVFFIALRLGEQVALIESTRTWPLRKLRPLLALAPATAQAHR
jgi:hypothetical protein